MTIESKYNPDATSEQEKDLEKREMERLIELFILPNDRQGVIQCVLDNAESKGTVRISSSAIPLFREVRKTLSTLTRRHQEEMEKELKIADDRWKRAEEHHRECHESDTEVCVPSFSHPTKDDLDHCIICAQGHDTPHRCSHPQEPQKE